MITRIWLTLGLLGSLAAKAQYTTLYQEDFDSPPHSVVSYHSLATAIPYWNDTSVLAVSSPMSFHSAVVPNDTVFFRTVSFSTLGMKVVRLSFDHIAKVHFAQRATIQVSIDSGATWRQLQSTEYLGASTAFNTLSHFNEAAYSTPNSTPYWGGPTVSTPAAPTNAWWAHEVFDLSAIAGGGPSGAWSGFNHVMVRFSLKYMTYTGTGPSPAGWFVDNVKVEGAPCEVVPPQMKWNTPTASRPEGVRYVPTHTVKLRVLDAGSANDGVDSVKLVHRVNGGPWVTTLMTKFGSATCVDSADYTGNLVTPSVGDSIEYYVQAKDCSCNHLWSRSPATPGTYYSLIRYNAPPAFCGANPTSSLPYVANIFPYVEDFDGPGWASGTGNGYSGTAHRGTFLTGNPPAGQNYEVLPAPTASGFAWSLRTGPTPTNFTGPAVDHTTGTGRYLFTEASQGVSGSFTMFTTPCIKLDNINNAALEFYFHRYGSTMGLLRVDIDTGTGFSSGSGVIGAFSIATNPQVSSTDAWSSAYVNLQPYLNKYIRLRFVGYKSGNPLDDYGDMAIDDIQVYDAPPVEIKAVRFVAPAQDKCSYGSQEVVKMQLNNRGATLSSTVQVGFSVKNLTTGAVTIRRDTVPVVWGSSRTATIEFVDRADLSAPSNHELRVWSEQPGDGMPYNDSLPPILYTYQAPITIPYRATFNGPSWVPTDGLPQNPGTFGTNDWTPNPLLNPTTGNYNYSFAVGKDLTPNPGTGPRWSRDRRGNYLYARGLSTIPTGAVSASLVSRCIDLSGAQNPIISFWTHLNGSNFSGLNVDVFNETTKQWVTLPSGSIYTSSQAFETDPWTYFASSLSSYAGSMIKLRIRIVATSGISEADLAIDDIYIGERPSNDVGIVGISSPGNSVAIGFGQPNISVTCRNFGNQNQTNVPVTVQVMDACNPSSIISYNQVLPSVLAGSTATLTFSNVTYSQGDMIIKAFTALPGDGLAFNDSTSKRVTGTLNVAVPAGPFTMDNCALDEHGFWVPSGSLQIWEMGTSTKGNGAASGTQAWHTGLSQKAYGPTSEYLMLPPFKGLDTIAGAELRFKHRFAFLNGDAGTLEYLYQNTWKPVPLGLVNAFTAPYGASLVTTLGPGPGWNTTTNNQYITSSFLLNFWRGHTDPLRLRFHFKIQSSAGSEWSIDDVEVVVPPQNTVSLLQARPTSYRVSTADSVAFEVNILNNGPLPVQNLRIKLDNLGAAPQYHTVTLATPLLPNQTAWVSLPPKFLLSPAGTFQPCFTVSRVNGRADGVPVGDTVCISVLSQAPQLVSSASPYCANFESVAWSVESRSNGASAWQRATPSHGSVQSAYNGTKAYATAPAGAYGANAREFLYSPVFTVDTGTTYTLSFYHSMFAEPSVDGGMLEYSLDGATWHPLGSSQAAGSVNWYNSPSVVALDGLAGWSSSWSGYQKSEIRLKSPNATKIILRFSFASSAYGVDYGWVVDQVCLEAAPSVGPNVVLNGQGPVYYSGCY